MFEFSNALRQACKDYPTNDKIKDLGEILAQWPSGVTLFEWRAKEEKEGYQNYVARILIPLCDYCILLEFVDLPSAQACFHTLSQDKASGCGIVPGEELSVELMNQAHKSTKNGTMKWGSWDMSPYFIDDPRNRRGT